MSDPFELLGAALVPADPHPAFAVRLRARLARALDLPKGVIVSTPAPDEPPTTVVARAAITPYLAVRDARAAIDWYAEAFDARLRGEPIVMADSTVGHVELEIAGATLMLSEQRPEMGVAAPVPGEGVPVTMHLLIADVDTIIGRAVAAGASLERPAQDYDYGRNGVIRDPFGHRWLISGTPRQPSLRAGDIGYVSLWLPDVPRAAAFFAAVLGWRSDPSDGRSGRQVEGLALPHGLSGGVDAPTLFCCYAVDDAAAAVVRVAAAGGTAETPHLEPYGVVSGCTDNQGTHFAVFEPPGGGASQVSERAQGARHGDLAYVTMEVVDSGLARVFYTSVLGWKFTPGRVADGWQVDDVTPMVGMSGGHRTATTLPMYRVDDIATAVEAARAAGGSATEPDLQPYGFIVTCIDDQGTRFYLGQLFS